MPVLQILKLFAFWLLLVGCFSASGTAQTDLSGLWTGQASGNQVTINMRSGGFAIAVTGQRQAGQYGDGQFFRDAGSGRYLFTRPDGQLVKAQVLGPNSMRVTNPDGWTDVFTRPPPAVAAAARNSPPVAFVPKAPPLSEKLPPARLAKMALWSPKAMPTDPQRSLSPQLAAERADALSSCIAPINKWASHHRMSVSAAILQLEDKALNDQVMLGSVTGLRAHIPVLDNSRSALSNEVGPVMAHNAIKCLYLRRIAQLEGSPLVFGAVDGSLTPLSIGGQIPPWKQQGKDARIIASDGKSAMHCVKVEQLAGGNSKVSGGGRRFYNGCPEEVEITWCVSPDECERKQGNTWTVQPGRGWPVSANGTVRFAACLGRDTASFVKDTFGLRYYCSAPLLKPKKN